MTNGFIPRNMSNNQSQGSKSESSNSVNASRQAGNDRETFVQDLAHALQGVFPRQNQQNGRNLVVSYFRQMGPPKLKGSEGPLATEEWIFELERIFEHLDCTDAERVSCAIFQLIEDAGHWWQTQARMMTRDRRRNLTWEAFKEMVMGKFFPRAYRKQKEMELMNLEQGTMTILDYERKFNRLSRYAPHLVDTEEKKVWRFEYGLRPEIGGILAGQGATTTFSEVVERAQAIATRLNVDNSAPRNNGKRRLEDQGDDENHEPEKRPKVDDDNQATLTRKPLCPQCQKRHNGRCYDGQNVCFYCHEEGHKSFDCPRKLQGGRNIPREANVPRRDNAPRKGNARCFAMNRDE